MIDSVSFLKLDWYDRSVINNKKLDVASGRINAVFKQLCQRKEGGGSTLRSGGGWAACFHFTGIIECRM